MLFGQPDQLRTFVYIAEAFSVRVTSAWPSLAIKAPQEVVTVHGRRGITGHANSAVLQTVFEQGTSLQPAFRHGDLPWSGQQDCVTS